jgi:hypothetical protein
MEIKKRAYPYKKDLKGLKFNLSKTPKINFKFGY